MTAAVERLRTSSNPVQEEVAWLLPLIHEHINLRPRCRKRFPMRAAAVAQSRGEIQGASLKGLGAEGSIVASVDQSKEQRLYPHIFRVLKKYTRIEVGFLIDV